MEITEVDISPYEWGYGITKGEWLLIKKTIDRFGVKTVLEFGQGLSTLLLVKAGMEVCSFEDKEEWIKVDFGEQSRVLLWDGDHFPESEYRQYDLAFVDGPYGGKNRFASTAIASLTSDLVLVHDCRRVEEKMWQGLFLERYFKKEDKVDNICLWKRRRRVNGTS